MKSSQTIIFQASRKKQVMLVFSGAILIAAGISLALPLFPRIAPGSFLRFSGWASVVFGLGIVGFCLWRLISKKNLSLILSPQGFHHSSISSAPISWSTVEGLSSWRLGGASSGTDFPTGTLVVKLSDSAWQSDSIFRPQIRETIRALGADGLMIPSIELSVSDNELKSLFQKYKDAYG